MRATKGNKAYTVDSVSMERYLKDGFDIYNDEGKLIKSGKGKMVPYDELVKLQSELEEIKASRGSDNPEAIEILRLYAGEHGIDVGKATTIVGIVKKIKEHGAGD